MTSLEGFCASVLTYITNVGSRRVRRDDNFQARRLYIAVVLVTISLDLMTVAANG